MSGGTAEIVIRRTGTETDLGGLPPEGVRYLKVSSEKKMADLDFLEAYPNVTQLFLRGRFADINAVSGLARLGSLTLYLSGAVDFSGLRVPALRDLTVGGPVDGSVAHLLNGGVERLELSGARRLADLSFLEGAGGLRKLYLRSLPAAEALPDFGKLPNLYALKLYELHKLSDMDSLTRSAVRYLAVSLSADKLSGTKLAEVLLGMERLERASLRGLDRSGLRRWGVIENQLKKAGREALLAEDLDMTRWELL